MWALCAFRASWTRSGRAFVLMYTERSVWFGNTGTLIDVICRLVVFLLPVVVVVFLTTIVTCTLPQRSAWPRPPVNDLFATMTFFGAARALVAAEAPTVGTVSATAASVIVSVFCMVRAPR